MRSGPETRPRCVPAAIESPSCTLPLHVDLLVELAEGLGRERGPGEHAVGRARRTRPRPVVLVDARERRDVAEDAEILGERVRDEPAHDRSRRIERGHRPAPRADARQRDEHGRGCAARDEPAEQARRTGPGTRGGCASRATRFASRRRRDDRARDAQQVDDLVARDAARGRSSASLARSASVSPASCRPSASRTTPQSDDITRCNAPRTSSGSVARSFGNTTGSASGGDRRPRGRARRVIAPVDSRRLLARRGSPRHPPTEDEPVEQRVRREPVRAVHAAARDLAARPEVVERGRAVEVGDDAAREIVRGRRDGQPLLGRIEIGAQAREPDRREVVLEVVDHRGVEPDVLLARRLHPFVDRARHDVARREIGERMQPGHERDAVDVAQHRAFAAQRLREQRPRHQRRVQRGRVELDELEVGARDAGLQRERDPVAGRERRDWS